MVGDKTVDITIDSRIGFGDLLLNGVKNCFGLIL